MSELLNKVVLVTGAGRGIGRGIANAFAAEGAIVAANDLTPINLDETMRQITANDGRGKDYLFDVAKKMPIQSMIEEIREDWGRIDILINNADVEPHASILEMDEWDWRRTIDVNLSGSFFTMQSVGRLMREQGGGVMVNIASLEGRAFGLKNRSAFIASKMGLIGLTHEAARELAAYNIRVNAICPGMIKSGIAANLCQDDAMLSKWLEDVPPGRLGRVGGVTGLVLFLCGDAAAHITGQALDVDGGR
jgi:NAD(P)-dependent dehydrogenase (short-subunit alcohol dehydrogenase family)